MCVLYNIFDNSLLVQSMLVLCDNKDYKLLNCNIRTEVVLCVSAPADSSSTLTSQMHGGLPHQGRSKRISGVKKGLGS